MVAQNRIPYRKPPGSNILRFDLDEIIAWTKVRNNKMTTDLEGATMRPFSLVAATSRRTNVDL
jgi:hypothetical protein